MTRPLDELVYAELASGARRAKDVAEALLAQVLPEGFGLGKLGTRDMLREVTQAIQRLHKEGRVSPVAGVKRRWEQRR